MSIPISTGAGTASIASEKVGNNDYQQIKIIGGETGSTSVMGVNPDGSIKVSVLGIANISGSVAAVITGMPTNTNVSGSVVAFQGTTPWTVGSIYGNISGSVVAFQAGTQVTSLVSTVPSSVIVGASIFGQLPAGTAPIGSVAVLQGTNPWATTNTGSIITTNVGSVITVFQSSSVIAVPVGSVIAVIQGSVSTGVFASPSVVQGTADLRVVLGGSVAALSAPGASIRLYVTAVQVSNFGPSSVLVKISDNTTSTLGWTIAPAGGGSNYNPLYRAAVNSPVTASLSGTASVLVSMQGYTSSS